MPMPPVPAIHSSNPPVTPPPARRRRRFPRVLAAVVATVVVLGAGGFLIWQSIDSNSPGQPGTSRQPDSAPVVAWTPAQVGLCSKVEIGRIKNGTQRCQRIAGTGQAWVSAPAEGFPAKSNPNGPLSGEPCDRPGTTDFDPTGVPMVCRGGKWVSSG
jgi:hypothetical protein